jgi:N-acetylneuraminate synthase
MELRIGDRLVGDGHPCFVIAEMGINHCGDTDTLRKLIAAAAFAGADMVKIQARTPRVCWPESKWSEPPKWPQSGCKTEGEWKEKLELSDEQMSMLLMLCAEHGLQWCASCWDCEAVDRIARFDPPCYKVASASLTDDDLLLHTQSQGKPLIVSTGMSTSAEIDRAAFGTLMVNGDTALLACTSTYPCQDNELNLRTIPALRERYGCPVGYSGHERGIATTVAAVALGACIVERHLTLDRSSWGSDQAASLEPHGFARMVRDIRAVESAMGDGVKRVYDSEKKSLEKLRRCKPANSATA